MIIRSSLLAALFLSGCSTLDPLAESPFKDESAGTDAAEVCSNTGIGIPEETETDWMAEYPLTTTWLVEGDYFQVTAECLTIAPMQITSDRDGQWPITQLEFVVAGGPNDHWVIDLAEAGLTIDTSQSGEVGWYESTESSCDEDQCEARWEIDLSNAGLTAGPDQTSLMTFDLEGLNDNVDEFWDENFDSLVLLTQMSGDTVDESEDPIFYSAISWTGMVIEPVE